LEILRKGGRLKRGDDKISSKNIKKKNKKMEKLKHGAIGNPLFIKK
jgi:predicted DNA-binding protein